MRSFLKFAPLYQQRVWGGRGLEQALGRALPAGGSIGESWEIVDRPEAQSIVADGPLAGRTLRQLIETRAAELMGPGWASERRFPVLVKWLDCRDRLSLQVHPPAAVAAELGGEPKTENWYFFQADAGAAVLAGLQPGVDARKFAQALEHGDVEQCMCRHATRAGDSLFIRSGVMHAIEAGNVILEIQQNSDTTYRVYDWGRAGLDGKPRALHVRESLACLAANTAPTPQLVRAAAEAAVLAECPEFRISRRPLADGETLRFAAREQPRILSVVEGSLRFANPGAGNPEGSALGCGDNILLPYASDLAFAAAGKTTVLVTDRFHHA
ncbi:MAG: class I mannose-6-phosphate isomerase [Opitutae bacterium]|nr:class I mannose-6-phosphate isomerase [Opitutae bacterium]